MKGKDFNKIFGPLQLKEEERKKHFLENEIITDPDMRSLARIIGVNSTKKHYYKRMVLFNKGDRPDKLYLVYQGQVLIWDDDLQGEDAHNEGGMFEGETNSKRKTKKGLLKLPIRVQVKKQLDLMISGRGKMIGEEEIFTGKRRRYNASIESESIIYEIEYERMLNVCSDNHFIRNILRQKIKDKTLIVDKIIEQKKKAEMVRDAFGHKIKTEIQDKDGFSDTDPDFLRLIKTSEMLKSMGHSKSKEPVTDRESSSLLNNQYRSSAGELDTIPKLEGDGKKMNKSRANLIQAIQTKSKSKSDIKSLVTRTKAPNIIINPGFLQRSKNVTEMEKKSPTEQKETSIKIQKSTISTKKDIGILSTPQLTLSPIKKSVSNFGNFTSRDRTVKEERDTNSSIHLALNNNKSMIYSNIIRDAETKIKWNLNNLSSSMKKNNQQFYKTTRTGKKSLQFAIEKVSSFEGRYDQIDPESLSQRTRIHQRLGSFTEARVKPINLQDASGNIEDIIATSDFTPTPLKSPALKTSKVYLKKKHTPAQFPILHIASQSIDLSKPEIISPFRKPNPNSFLITSIQESMNTMKRNSIIKLKRLRSNS